MKGNICQVLEECLLELKFWGFVWSKESPIYAKVGGKKRINKICVKPIMLSIIKICFKYRTFQLKENV